jgi:hypothetical protein
MEIQTKLIISTFNCRSVKSSVHEIKSLCGSVYILMLQEHWLLPNELNFLNSIHSVVLATAYSAVDLSQGILVGRPYGGTAVFFIGRGWLLESSLSKPMIHVFVL